MVICGYSRPAVSETLRNRLYRYYVSSGRANPPDTLADLAVRAPYLRRVIARHFPADRDAAIYDVGCGYGALLHFAREAGYRSLRGVDISAEQVELAARLGIRGVEQGDLLEGLTLLPSDSQDGITAFDVMEHLGKDELLPFVDAAYRALKPGGRFVLHVPNGESPFFGAIRHGDLTHELAFTRESVSQLLLASGYATVECFEDEPVPRGLKSGVRWLVWKAVRAVLRVYVAAETGHAGREVVFSRNLLAVAVK